MYAYTHDPETGGLLLNSSPLSFSKEPRPVYYKELDILGFDQYWEYAKNDTYPYLWAEANNYYYRGNLVAKTKGGSLYTAPEIEILEEPETDGQPLRFVDVPAMVEKNRDLIEKLAADTIKKIYNTYMDYKDKVDVFYVAFSGGKDSVVALDLVQRTLPHNQFKVLFGDTGMEFPDTYAVVDQIEKYCSSNGIAFFKARSKWSPFQTWKIFGPPSTANRWCCSVHKTSPQINLLRQITGKYNFTGMAFTGIRAEESLTRSEYDLVNDGKKHSGQLSCHEILEWNSAELFLYIFSRNLILNNAYKKGNTRAGCLVCPNSSGKHEYIKQTCYPTEVDQYIDMISSTSGKTNYNTNEMKMFIDSGFWRTRKSGQELNFGHDCFEVKSDPIQPVITVNKPELRWEMWAKTIGEFHQAEPNIFVIKFHDKLYHIKLISTDTSIVFSLTNYENSKEDIRFFSLFRSVIVKSIYCIGCGVCEAECKSHCIDMSDGIKIGNNCTHCYHCHDIHEHCLRYNSIRNRISEGRKMAGLDRYRGHGVRREWMAIFCKYNCGVDFWLSDGDNQVPNKKKEAFRYFVLDAGMVVYDKNAEGDKYTRCIPTTLAETICKIGAFEDAAWALILCNLVYTSDFNWYVHNLKSGVTYTTALLKEMLMDVMVNDLSGHGKENIINALKTTLVKTPLGVSQIFAKCNVDLKVSASGRESITLNTLERCTWQSPNPIVILYSLYKFAEACGGYYQFTLSRLLNHDVESDGVSPTEIFGLDRDQMEKLLTGLSINYPDYINASFTLDLDNITLYAEKSSQDVLSLF